MTMHPRPCGRTPKWGVGKLTWDGESATPAWVDEEGNRRPADQRAQDKRARRKKTKAEKERAAKTERARKKRLKEDEEKERRMQQELETPTPVGGAEGQPLDGGHPGAGATKKHKLERENGYDTNNDLNQLLTQCLICTVKDRKRAALLVEHAFGVQAARALLGLRAVDGVGGDVQAVVGEARQREARLGVLDKVRVRACRVQLTRRAGLSRRCGSCRSGRICLSPRVCLLIHSL